MVFDHRCFGPDDNQKSNCTPYRNRVDAHFDWSNSVYRSGHIALHYFRIVHNRYVGAGSNISEALSNLRHHSLPTHAKKPRRNLADHTPIKSSIRGICSIRDR